MSKVIHTCISLLKFYSTCVLKSCATFSTNKMQKIILAFSRARIWLIQVIIGSFRYSSSFWLAAVCTLSLLYDNWWTALNVSINTISCITDMTVYNLTSVLSVAVWSSPRFWSGFPREERKSQTSSFAQLANDSKMTKTRKKSRKKSRQHIPSPPFCRSSS